MNEAKSISERLTLDLVIRKNESVLGEQMELCSKMSYILCRLTRQDSKIEPPIIEPTKGMTIVEELDYQNKQMRMMLKDLYDISDKILSLIE
jgi:hypothetical protein